MIFKNDLQFSRSLDEQDPLKNMRDAFIIPQHNGTDAIYLCGNSLGLQPKAVQTEVAKQLSAWATKGVEGWFDGVEPWLDYQQSLKGTLEDILGAGAHEISIMNSLTVNLHLLMVSFYQPTNKRYKILMEGGAFPSDQYAVESQVRYHGLEPDDTIIEVFPREGEYTLHTEDIIQAINDHADELSLVLFSGINYYTGQFFDIKAITEAAHAVGVCAGFDLAHAAGNVPLKLHEWKADFACWCSYKYLNSGPGGISGIFVHEKHHSDITLDRFAGWWGNRRSTQFKMEKGFDPEAGADGWQVSTAPILLMAAHKAALSAHGSAGGIGKLRQKSLRLTGYFEFLINSVNTGIGEELFKIITPTDPEHRGAQLSIICQQNGKAIFDYLTEHGVIGDWREPDVIRLSAVPLYNTFTEVYLTGQLLAEAAKKFN
ncbi:kynureninase [Mucilaginibacter myungsuensis]|uniref:Kynureninase n=1 Tax=Mucilaginibacter myungsuensis TaxID=649104 RepID=A0A929L4Q1_9SPHI|nr:kynureninase [Mucilaginibacter myungsuensis]MBE9664424.1 kynureninase [Mucilaginibacter myungsuensis]MDN3597135.1 kynureninase [Mucilaginibacter myungsuensis]